jgi:hypothetical protein
MARWDNFTFTCVVVVVVVVTVVVAVVVSVVVAAAAMVVVVVVVTVVVVAIVVTTTINLTHFIHNYVSKYLLAISKVFSVFTSRSTSLLASNSVSLFFFMIFMF